MSRAATPSGKTRHACPLCGKPPAAAHSPFCSQGCRDRDLLNWLGDSYRVAGPPADENSLGALGEDGEGGLDR
jgi:endogenous inhibitor of DNA gyrase (YacG/DUF329 family)